MAGFFIPVPLVYRLRALSICFACKRIPQTSSTYEDAWGHYLFYLVNMLFLGTNCRSYAENREGQNTHSVVFVLDMAVNGADLIRKPEGTPGVKRAREVFIRKEITNQVPNANTISHPDSSYILRKNIIFLFFYWFWVRCSLEGYSVRSEEDFRDEMYNILHRCGFSPLYFGNPYDWLFLYCSNFVLNDISPIEVFRAILAGNEDF